MRCSVRSMRSRCSLISRLQVARVVAQLLGDALADVGHPVRAAEPLAERAQDATWRSTSSRRLTLLGQVPLVRLVLHR